MDSLEKLNQSFYLVSRESRVEGTERGGGGGGGRERERERERELVQQLNDLSIIISDEAMSCSEDSDLDITG